MNADEVRAGYRDVDRANEVRLASVLADYFGIEIPDDGTSFKARCPFDFEHVDGGIERAFRLYPATNAGMCFAMHGSMNPVRVICLSKDIRPFEAAREILKRYGLRSEGPYQERFAQIIEARAKPREVGSLANLVAALHLALGDAAHDTRRLDSTLEELDALVATGVDAEGLRRWYVKVREGLVREGV